MKTLLKTLILTSLISLPMAACGIKPKSVDAPQGNDKDQFPRTYPAKK